MNTTSAGYAAGTRIEVRDEEWVVLGTDTTDHDGLKVRAMGQSHLVRDMEATFFESLDEIKVIDPEDTRLVNDDSSRFVRSRLFLEAVMRRTPLPRTESGLAMTDRFLMEPNTFQQRPAARALEGLHPRILIADVVGFGKTLEIGLTLAELIRRGRGERILVVTPQHVLEQFQREMWTRFSIPLLRLDSRGIARVQQQLPAGRNPFTVHKRVIVSVDTLKNVGMYRHHLENIAWDAVVIDESHNLIGSGTKSLRRKLANVLAPRTDALLLASATPHNGDAKSFAELVNLLDPTAIADEHNYSAKDIAHLYIRRTKSDPEMREQAGAKWAKRRSPATTRVAATPEEERVFEELVHTWFSGTVQLKNRLFPYTLLKAFLSSPQALLDSVAARRKTVADDDSVEGKALARLEELAEDIVRPAKLTALLEQLKAAGVKKGSSTRVVVFSERVPTLHWLAATIERELKLPAGGVGVLHGGLTDTRQQEIVEEFALAKSPIRVLVTGDVASEGVNLHQQCHQLIHYDIPWSLIRIEQRNGRIDRYGQTTPPEFSALILTSQVDGAKDDTVVAEKLLHKEDQAHRALGTAETVMGVYSARQEDDRLTHDLLRGRDIEESLDEMEAESAETPLAAMLNGDSTSDIEDPPDLAQQPVLFGSTGEFVETALRELLGDDPALNLNREDDAMFLNPPEDLKRRLRQLPPDYVRERGVMDRLKVTDSTKLANRQLQAAKENDKTAWPDISYLSDLHPLTQWLVDKALTQLGRGTAPVIYCGVDKPTFAVQGIFNNALGQATIVKWMAITGDPADPVADLFDVFATAGVRAGMANPGSVAPVSQLQELVKPVVETASAHMAQHRGDWDDSIKDQIAHHRKRLDVWKQDALAGLDNTPQGRVRGRNIADADERQRDHIDKLATNGLPLIRVLAVLAPRKGN